ncbi:eukaryotic translation initiation factor 3 subunit F, partial [Trichonephila clavata]
TSFGVPGKNTGTMFTPCKVEIVGYEPEFVGIMDLISKHSDSLFYEMGGFNLSENAQQTKHNKQRSVEILPDLDMINNAIQNMLELSDVVIGYIDDVLANRKPADNSIGRTLMDIVQSIPQISPEQFQDMLNSNMKDLLMVVYLAQLTRSQLALHEKISFL